MVEVFGTERVDDKTILVEVKLTNPATKEFIAAFVHVTADLDDFSKDNPTLSPGIRSRAIDNAHEFAKRFYEETKFRG